MSVEENKAIARRFIEGYNNRNLDLFDELVAPDFVDHTHQLRGREDYKQMFTNGFDGFPDWHETIKDIIAEGDKVWVWVEATATNTGKWSISGVPLAPTGNRITMPMVFIWRITNGKLTEVWEMDDGLDFQKQLGFIEYTKKRKELFPEDAK